MLAEHARSTEIKKRTNHYSSLSSLFTSACVWNGNHNDNNRSDNYSYFSIIFIITIIIRARARARATEFRYNYCTARAQTTRHRRRRLLRRGRNGGGGNIFQKSSAYTPLTRNNNLYDVYPIPEAAFVLFYSTVAISLCSAARTKTIIIIIVFCFFPKRSNILPNIYIYTYATPLLFVVYIVHHGTYRRLRYYYYWIFSATGLKAVAKTISDVKITRRVHAA